VNKVKYQNYVAWFTDVSRGDIALVGGKNASLGEMIRELQPKGVNVPPGFAITVAAYWRHLDANNLRLPIDDLLAALERHPEGTPETASRIRHLILEAPLPSDVATAITAAYTELCDQHRGMIEVAVRSSATAEDLPDASFAGQQESFLNVRGSAALLETCRQCFASLFTDRAVSYRRDKGFDPFKNGLSVGVQQMVRSDLATAGVMFTLDTETGHRHVVLINASYGLGETVVQGAVNPDEIYVFKPTLGQGKRPILRKKIGSKEFKIIYETGAGRRTRSVPVPQEERERLCISDDDIIQLAQWACQIEDHYSDKSHKLTPMDIEWAKDGQTGKLFIVQARPETVESQRSTLMLEQYVIAKEARADAKILLQGRAVGQRIGSGRARLIRDVKNLAELQQGEVLVAQRTDPDWEPAMKRASAIVTDHGGRTCHAAIVSRELGIPAVVGTEKATSLIVDGTEVTVSCCDGDTGYVYAGLIPFERHEATAAAVKPSFTNILLNVGNPDEALRLSLLPCDGVGLARMEFIISHDVRIHPMALIRFDQLADGAEKQEILQLTAAYATKTDYFVSKLAEGIAMIAAAFYPREVIVRCSDFKTNEYAGLLGGSGFEPKEENPMLGFRGASRYYHERYRQAFALECAAIVRVRDTMGLKNVKVMIPFCRTPEEGRKVLTEMAKNGLKRGELGLEVYCMCEIPSNIILAREFAEIFDGFSIGSNDLTQLVLGIDRDSELVAPIFDERSKAVTTLIEMVIETVHAAGKKVGICGQAPSDYPEFATMLVKLSIDSISLNPDSFIRAAQTIACAEEISGDR